VLIWRLRLGCPSSAPEARLALKCRFSSEALVRQSGGTGCFVRVVPGPEMSDLTVLHPHDVGPEKFQSRPLIAAEHFDPSLGQNQVSSVDDVSASNALEMDEVAPRNQ
jgi:hypothetical protein